VAVRITASVQAKIFSTSRTPRILKANNLATRWTNQNKVTFFTRTFYLPCFISLIVINFDKLAVSKLDLQVTVLRNIDAAYLNVKQRQYRSVGESSGTSIASVKPALSLLHDSRCSQTLSSDFPTLNPIAELTPPRKSVYSGN
jgi:hypothetical protein